MASSSRDTIEATGCESEQVFPLVVQLSRLLTAAVSVAFGCFLAGMLTKLVPVVGLPAFVTIVFCLTIGVTSLLTLDLWNPYFDRYSWFRVLSGIVVGFVMALWMICIGILEALGSLKSDYFWPVVGMLAIMMGVFTFLFSRKERRNHKQ